MRRLAVACPALPTCGQALAEAERVLPEDRPPPSRTGWPSVGLDGTEVRVHVTGCPNGCARPYTAEIGIVGRTKTAYDVYVGGAATGERLARRLAIERQARRPRRPRSGRSWSATQHERLDGEGVGDFANRLGLGEPTHGEVLACRS